MLSLTHIRKNIFRQGLGTGLFCLFFLFTALTAGAVHNHSDDPLHTQEHNDCPAAVWSHTPFAFFGLSLQLLFSALIVAALFQFFVSIPQQERFSPQSPRAPPIFT